MAISKEFQKRINELISEADFSFTKFTKESKLSQSSLSQAKNYGIIPKPKTLIKIADYFDCSIEFLLGETEKSDLIKADKPVSFLVRLNDLLKGKNMTFYALSKAIHIEPNSLSTWKSKNYIPSLENLLLLSDFFECSIDYLLGRTDEPFKE